MNQVVLLLILSVVFGGIMIVAVQMRHSWARTIYASVMSAVRWWMVPAALAALFATVVTSLLLLSVPALRWSWWSAIGGVGNVSLGQIAPATSSGGGSGDSLVRWGIVVLGVVIPVALIAGVPMLAWQEEVLFRHGTEHFGPVAASWRSLQFGLIHVFAGVPIGVSIALSVAGMAFHLVYRANAPRQIPADLSPPKAGVSHADSHLSNSAADAAVATAADAQHGDGLVAAPPDGVASWTRQIDDVEQFLNATRRYDELVGDHRRPLGPVMCSLATRSALSIGARRNRARS